jgi:Ca-activated chloride channel family protein
VKGFEHPYALFLLLLPPLAFLLAHLFPRTAARPFPSASARSAFSWSSGPRVLFRKVSAIAFWLAVVSAVLAVAGPGKGMKKRLYLERGPDIVFAIDASPSMAALEGGTSRLVKALGLVRDLAESGGNASLGVIAFGSEMTLVSPPTEDRAYLLSRLAGLEPGMLGDGTDLGLGMAGALYHLDASKAPHRLAVIITDGEDNERSVDPERCAALFARSGIPLIILGIGKPGETAIRYEEKGTGRTIEGTYVSGYDPSGLVSLARAAGGEFLAAESAEAIPRVRAEILSASSPSLSYRDEARGSSLVFPLALIALLLMALSRSLALAAGASS